MSFNINFCKDGTTQAPPGVHHCLYMMHTGAGVIRVNQAENTSSQNITEVKQLGPWLALEWGDHSSVLVDAVPVVKNTINYSRAKIIFFQGAASLKGPSSFKSKCTNLREL